MTIQAQDRKNLSLVPDIRESLPVNERISRIQRRYQTGDAFISVERARYYTQSWQATKGQGLARSVRIALAMKNVMSRMTHLVDPDDRIAGHWTQYFLGIPIDIERGVFNKVLESELTKKRIIFHRGRSLAKGLAYMVRKRSLGEFIGNQRLAKAGGAPPLDMGFQTMSERKINPFQIDQGDRRELLTDLLPYWRGKTIVDRVEDELIRSGLYSKDMHDFAVALPGNTSRQVAMLSTCATIATYQGHVILDYEKVVKQGLVAMQQEVINRLEQAEKLKPEEKEFLESIAITIDGVMIYAARLAEAIEEKIATEPDEKQKVILEKMLATCCVVPLKPADTFEQAIQSLWTLKTAVELAHPVNLHCFGRLDQILFPFYQNDIESKLISPDEALEQVEELLLKIMAQNIRPESNLLGNFYHRFLGSSPVTVGGVKPNGEDATNELTYLFLKAAHRSKAVTNLSVRVGPKTPDAVLERVAQYLAEGTSSFSIFNDRTTIEAMEKRGFDPEDARDYAIMGCVEATCPGKTGYMSANALQLVRLLDITCRNGDSRILAGMIKDEGLKTGDPDDFTDFDQFLAALLKQAEHFISKLVEGSNLRDRLFAEYLPAPYISAFMTGCLENKTDVTAGGARYSMSGISMINSVANLVDSLLVIKKLVYEKRSFSLRKLTEAIDGNFVGYEDIQRQINELPGKWGNGDPETDELARRVTKALFALTYPHRTINDGPFVVYVISMITHTIDGRLSIASPDGRMAASPYAASCNPYNVERSGVTATFRSVASLPFEDVMGCAVNMKFHPSGIGKNAKSRAKWISLIRSYFQLGGAQIQPTVASAQMLRQAQTDPEKYRDLIVKVGGYSTYFVDLGREIQEEVIARTEHR